MGYMTIGKERGVLYMMAIHGSLKKLLTFYGIALWYIIITIHTKLANSSGSDTKLMRLGRETNWTTFLMT